MHISLSIVLALASAALADAGDPIVPISKFSALCSKMGVYAFDKKEDAWVIRNKIKGDPSRVNARWDTRLFGPRPRIQPEEAGYYRLSFELELHDGLGRVRQTNYRELNNTTAGGRIVFVIDKLPEWVLNRLGVSSDSGTIILALPENADVQTKTKAGEAGAGEPAIRAESGTEGGEKPQPNSDGRSR